MSDHVILDSNTHRDLRVQTAAGEEYGDAVMSALVVPEEFRQVQAYYPIVFRKDLERGAFAALALFGFEKGENLYLDGNQWDARYKPLAAAIKPFLVGRAADGEGPGQVHIDMRHPRVTAGEGIRVFDDHGQPTPYLEDMAEKLGRLDAGYRASVDFFAALERHELLEPFALEVTLDNSETNRLVGFHIIDEARLRGLDKDALGELHGEGHLMPLFMALASLSHLTALVDRKNRKHAGG